MIERFRFRPSYVRLFVVFALEIIIMTAGNPGFAWRTSSNGMGLPSAARTEAVESSYETSRANGVLTAVISTVSVIPTPQVGGKNATGEVTLSAPAPAGGAVVTLSTSSSLAIAPKSVRVYPRESVAAFNIRTKRVVSSTSVTVSATYGSTATTTLTIVANAAALSSVTLNPTTVTGGSTSEGTVNLTSGAPSGGAVVSLSSSDTAKATVPTSLTVAVGSTSAGFIVNTSAVTSATNVTISGAYAGVSKSAILTINPPPPSVGLSALSVFPTSVVGGSTSQGTVTLTAAAPSGGASVSLSSSNTAIATVPTSVTVAAGSTSTGFVVNTSVVTSASNVTIGGSYAGTSKSAVLTVNPLPPVVVSSVSLNPTSVFGGASSQGTVTLSDLAPGGGALVSLSSSNTSVASVSASVSVPAGLLSANFTVSTVAVASSTSVTISAAFGGSSTGSTLTVQPPAAGVQYFVATNGSDSNSGTQVSPFRTINRGANALHAGETLVVRAGTYNETVYDKIPPGTSWTSPTTVRVYPGETVIIRPNTGNYRAVYFAYFSTQFIVFDGFIVDAANVQGEAVKITVGANHIRLQNCEIMNAPTMGILVTDPGSSYNEIVNCRVHNIGSSTQLDHAIYITTRNNLVDGCRIYDALSHGIHLYGDPGMDNNIFRNNVIYNCKRGIGIYGGSGNLVYNNVIYDHVEYGILLRNDAQDLGGAMLYNNTIYNAGNNGIYNFTTGISGTLIRNNIVYGHATDIVDGTHIAVLQNNLVGVDPRFVNLASRDFHLQSGSPAVDAAMTLSQVSTDKDGINRPQGGAYDIGAYER